MPFGEFDKSIGALIERSVRAGKGKPTSFDMAERKGEADLAQCSEASNRACPIVTGNPVVFEHHDDRNGRRRELVGAALQAAQVIEGSVPLLNPRVRCAAKCERTERRMNRPPVKIQARPRCTLTPVLGASSAEPWYITYSVVLMVTEIAPKPPYGSYC